MDLLDWSVWSHDLRDRSENFGGDQKLAGKGESVGVVDIRESELAKEGPESWGWECRIVPYLVLYRRRSLRLTVVGAFLKVGMGPGNQRKVQTYDGWPDTHSSRRVQIRSQNGSSGLLGRDTAISSTTGGGVLGHGRP